MSLVMMMPLYALATPVQEGVYISGNKRIHLSSYIRDGIRNYELFLANFTGSSSFVTTSKSKTIQNNDTVIFTVPPDPYADVQTNVGCMVQAKFSPDEVFLRAYNNCPSVEQAFNGNYVYSKEAGTIPKKYWGKWGYCHFDKASREGEQPFISAHTGSADGTYRFDVLKINEASPKKLSLVGAFFDEGYAATHSVTFEYLSNNRVRTNVDWSEDSYIYEKCRD